MAKGSADDLQFESCKALSNMNTKLCYMKTSILTSFLLILVSSLSSFTKPDAAKFQVDTKASSVQWTATKVTGFHTGTAPLLEFPATVKQDGKRLTASARIKVNRTNYDIRFRSSSFFENLGDKAIADEFELDLKLVANLHKGV